jgi:hypothetical protein
MRPRAAAVNATFTLCPIGGGHDLVLACFGIGVAGYLGNADRRLDCDGGWWLQTGATNANGTVTPSPSKACYESGDLVSLQATPQTSYYLLQWMGDASGTNNPLALTMDDNKKRFEAQSRIWTQRFVLMR